MYKGSGIGDKWEIYMKDDEICLYGTRVNVRVAKNDITRIAESRSELSIFGKDGTLYSGFNIPRTVEHYEELKAQLSKWKPIEAEQDSEA